MREHEPTRSIIPPESSPVSTPAMRCRFCQRFIPLLQYQAHVTGCALSPQRTSEPE